MPLFPYLTVTSIIHTICNKGELNFSLPRPFAPGSESSTVPGVELSLPGTFHSRIEDGTEVPTVTFLALK